ncbi:pentatricopeptide repeat-containing protein At1g77360, mitochondrial-like [Durio zibethinus]|uniref:Pentatricopeptide repeat-containing protein At1g77360, mitochondrial-like n=1 Tax=Durio zibethinus TaxID=66656 RepID=A0A6P6AM19_DURZI|nr:pentatricopeptide repeat-containing protein At1g77360, mitochondrial-like [Durio zibethinus]
MIKVYNCRHKLLLGWIALVRSYCSSESTRDVLVTSNKVCKIMMSSSPMVLDTALDQSGLRVSPEVVEDVLKRFENAGMLAYRFFEWAEKQRNYMHSIRAYHTMIESLAKIRQYQIMWDLVNTMRNKSMLNVETFCIIMRRYARVQKVEEAIYTFNVMEKYGVPPNLAAFNGLLSTLCKSKNVRKAQEIFDRMKDQFVLDSKTYSILLEGWGRAPNLPKAREIFREMVDMGCDPDIIQLLETILNSSVSSNFISINTLREGIFTSIGNTAFISYTSENVVAPVEVRIDLPLYHSFLNDMVLNDDV